MSARSAKLLTILGLLGLCLGLVVGLAAAMPLLGLPLFGQWWRHAPPGTPVRNQSEFTAELVPDQPDTLLLPAEVAQALRLQTIEAREVTQPRSLELSGSLALDGNHLARVHARFAGEIAEIAQVEDNLRPGGQTAFRPLRPGDKVAGGQLLAVVWSKDLGEKKSELVDALSKLRLDKETLQRLQELYEKGALPERSLREAERDVEADEIARARAERTLRSWRLTETEIEAVQSEARRTGQGPKAQDKALEKDWARVEVRAPFDGTVVEKNVAVGDIVDTTAELFKIADLRSLAVWAHAYEEDLSPLLALAPYEVRWTIRLKSDPEAAPLEGVIDHVGDIIDPNQHTALVTGWANNPEGRLRAGQFITATVELPLTRPEVVIPASALLEDGRQNLVFVHPGRGEFRYAVRRVAIARRLPGGVCVRSTVSPQDRRLGIQPLQEGERVACSGVVELRALLENLQAAARP